MKSKILLIIGLIITATTILFALNATTFKPNKYNNGFQRQFLRLKLSEQNVTYLKVPVIGICGYRNDSLFLSGYKPGKIYMRSNRTNSVDSFSLDLASIPNLELRFENFVHFPDVYIISGAAKTFIHGNLVTGKYETRPIPDRAFFKVVQLHSDAYVMQVIDSQSFNAVFKKLNPGTGAVVNEDHLSTPLGDAGFTNDGILNYSTELNRLIYVPFYNNNFLFFDTTLRLITKGHTIDTTRTPRQSFVRKDGGVTRKSPPQMINTHNWTFGSMLYVRSILRADNEPYESFNKNLTIDCYNLLNGKYIGSFYVPAIKDKKPFEFKMTDNQTLLVLYSDRIVQYQMQPL